MTDFIELRFPDDIAYGSACGAEYSTDVVTTSSGYEYRNINWSEARLKYNVLCGIKNQEQLDKIIALFRICKGRGIGFRFKDWSDYIAFNQLIGIGDGCSREFQLIKQYKFGSSITNRVIKKPVKKTISIYLNNIKTNAIIDHKTGRIIFDTPIEKDTSITADYEFDVPVRFDADQIHASIHDYGLYAIDGITLTEIKI